MKIIELKLLKTLLILLYLILFNHICTAQRVIPEELSIYPTLIEWDQNSSASGFFMIHKDNAYLITARHVLFSETRSGLNLISDSINVSYYPRDPNISSVTL